MVRYDVEKFDGKINFGLWQVQVKDLLIQSGLHKALKGRVIPEKSGDGSTTDASATASVVTGKAVMGDDDWEDLDLRAASAIRLNLAKNVLANVHGITTAKELWEKLEELYQTKGVSNRVYLKEQFHTLRMREGTTLSDHLSVLNGIVAELESIGIKIDEEDQALRLIWSLPRSYEHMKPILIHGKDKISLSEVTGKLISEERRLSGSNNSDDIPLESHVAVAQVRRKKNFAKIVCWGCGKQGHTKRNCPNDGAGSANGSKSVRGDTDDDAGTFSYLDVA